MSLPILTLILNTAVVKRLSNISTNNTAEKEPLLPPPLSPIALAAQSET